MKPILSCVVLLWLCRFPFAVGAEMAEPDCLSRLVAPTKLQSPPAWRTDSGPLLIAFADLRRGDSVFKVEHGFDLSHHNIKHVSYDEIKRCGATFAVVKMDPQYKAHVSELAKRGITTIPYHYLGMFGPNDIDYKLNPQFFSGINGKPLSQDELNQSLVLARKLGSAAASKFIAKYEESTPQNVRVAKLGGLDSEIIALDVEEAFSVPSTRSQRVAYGRFYSAMLAAWVQSVRGAYPQATIVFYTFPSMFLDYLNFALPSDNAVIHGLPIWLANMRPNAEDIDMTKLHIQRLCGSTSGGNRCIIHQYSQRALFGVKKIKVSPPPHLDVNRLFHVRKVADESGSQYVRQEDAAPSAR